MECGNDRGICKSIFNLKVWFFFEESVINLILYSYKWDKNWFLVFF